jgi:hypothetical protein
MNINNIIAYFLIIIIISILCPRLTKNSLFFLISLIIIGYNITRNLSISVGVSIFITYILVLLNNRSNLITENFKAHGKSKSKGRGKGRGKGKGKGKKHHKKKQDNDTIIEQEDEPVSDNEEEHMLDSKNSFLENYKSLTPIQIKGLNRDTKELIKTQRSLIETLNTMGPTLKEGKTVLDTFKNYFGKDVDI